MAKTAKWKKLSEEEFAKLVKESRSFQDLAARIGYVKTGGGTQTALKQAVKDKGLDTSHFKGMGWNKDNFDYSTFKDGYLKKNGKGTLKALLSIKGRKCENCGLDTWLEKPITLEIHHIDGNHNNNHLDNLQLLCPNCHSYTDNYRGKKNTGKIKVTDEEFIKALENSNNISQALKRCNLSLGSGNYKRANELIIKYQISKYLK